MNNFERPYQWHVERAEHYLALGQRDVHLFQVYNSAEAEEAWQMNLPWHLVTKVKSGGTGRYNMNVSAGFEAPHPCGLTFHWSFDYEPRGKRMGHSNGPMAFDFERIHWCMNQLPKQYQSVFADQLQEAATEGATYVKQAYDNYIELLGRLKNLQQIQKEYREAGNGSSSSVTY